MVFLTILRFIEFTACVARGGSVERSFAKPFRILVVKGNDEKWSHELKVLWNLFYGIVSTVLPDKSVICILLLKVSAIKKCVEFESIPDG